MSRYRTSVIRLADIQEFCCSPDCENPHIASLPVPLCSECYDKIHQHAVTEVFERIRPLWMKYHSVERLDEARRADEEERRARSVVYIIRFSDRYKIGTTTDLIGRLVNVPHDEVLLTFPGGRDEERALHQRFAGHHVIGEWFAVNDETTAMVQRLIDWQARQAG